jgi:hypothetical protein
MGYCGPRGIAHEGEFLTWSASDRSKALWWYVRDRDTCGKCGTRPEEWDPKRGGRRWAYYAQIRTCAGCEVRERAEDPPPVGRGTYVALIRTPEEDEVG